jgi:hypothetical protein
MVPMSRAVTVRAWLVAAAPMLALELQPLLLHTASAGVILSERLIVIN